MLGLGPILILLVAALSFGSSEAYAQPLDDRTLPPRVDSLPRKGSLSPPLPKESDIKEEDLPEERSGPPAVVDSPLPGGAPAGPTIPDDASRTEPEGEGPGPEGQLRLDRGALPSGEEKQGSTITPSRESASPRPDEPSLIAKITPETSPRRAASLRLTEEGKRLLESREYGKALERLEKTMAIDSTNPYSYYYLARAHYHLTRYRESFNFLDVAESLLSEEPYWLAQVFALKGKNFQALGSFERADASYVHALKLDPSNQAAFTAMTRIRVEKEGPAPSR